MRPTICTGVEGPGKNWQTEDECYFFVFDFVREREEEGRIVVYVRSANTDVYICISMQKNEKECSVDKIIVKLTR